MATARKLSVVSDASPKAPRTPRSKPLTRLQRINKFARVYGVTTSCATLAGTMLVVSMPHLRDGFKDAIGCELLSAWALAIAFDLTQVMGKVTLTKGVKGHARTVAIALTITCTLMSISFNVHAFLEKAKPGTFGTVFAWITGTILPLAILGLSYIGAHEFKRTK